MPQERAAALNKPSSQVEGKEVRKATPRKGQRGKADSRQPGDARGQDGGGAGQEAGRNLEQESRGGSVIIGAVDGHDSPDRTPDSYYGKSASLAEASGAGRLNQQSYNQ